MYERGDTGNKVKEFYDYRCMVPGCRYNEIQIEGKPSPHAHHLALLSRRGLDKPANIVVLCPNHHALFHHGECERHEWTGNTLHVRINEVSIDLTIEHVDIEFQ
jgi:predicted restriction endonuclease